MLEIRLLGTVAIAHDGVDVVLGKRHERCLFGILALEAGRSIGTERLLRLLWPDEAPASARATLHTYVARLRGRLAGCGVSIVTRDSGYLMQVAPSDVDVHRFTDLLGQAIDEPAPDRRFALLTDALRVWGGDLMEGTADDRLRDSLDASLDQRFLLAHELLAETGLELGHVEHTLSYLPELVRRHPARERLAAALIRAYHQCGDVASALSAYETVRRHLADELGLDPGANLSNLYLSLLHRRGPGDPPALPAPLVVPAQLPPATRVFAARDAELAELDLLVVEHASAVVISAIAGSPGIGKTTLAVHWAHTLSDQYPDGSLYVNLRGFDPNGRAVNPDEAVRGFLEALNVAPGQMPTTLEAKTGLYRSLLANRRMLILLDNARDAAQVRPLLPGTRGCLVIITSRSQLGSLVTAEGAVPLTLGLLTATDAIKLLSRRIGGERIAAEPEAAMEIVHRCAGLPLALALVAARAVARPQAGLSRLAEELAASPSPLDVLSSDDRATDMRAVFSWSYQALSAPAAELFRLLGLHPGPVRTTQAAAALAAVSPAAARVLLGELERAHLVTEDAEDQFSLHDLLQAYAADLAAGSAATPSGAAANARAVERLLDHFLISAYEGDLLLDPHRDRVAPPDGSPHAHPFLPRDHEEALAWFTANHATALAVTRLCDTGGYDRHLWELAWCLGNYFERQGHWHQWIESQALALAAAVRLGDAHAQARCHRALSRAHQRLDDRPAAFSHLTEALRIYQEHQDPIGQAYTHLNLNVWHESEGRYELALGHAQTAFDLFEQAGNVAGQALSRNAIGWGHAKLGAHETALRYCQQALTQLREIGHQAGAADTLDSIGFVYLGLDDPVRAAEAYEAARDLFEQLGDRYNQATSHLRIGDILAGQDQPGPARQQWETAWRILRDLGHPDAVAVGRRLHDPSAAPHG
ncbi:SARP family transcriptional regulator [Catellatospora sp. TT07R-123]|uniref:AfsR/SARP family transcriptional regulator n=1 Tax=Catellatospora sp. TT07R-123 TaxID=2733863 RepID=UPI001B1333BB|nr:BTAD domain-containing putative transcriptional regulator [Catellatospora sp. TT07R-123]GHJ48322.1 SARP family transcriptional regulator [Catellatospora sp. TT07R-123]